jgi:hypothetical protein
MVDVESRLIDRKILCFIERYRQTKAPDDVFQTLAFEIFRYQFRRNVFYRKFCALENKSPATVKTWKEIPAMPTLAFKELVLASFPVKTRVCVFRTSGTTQEIKGAHFFDTLSLYEGSLIPSFEKYLLADHASLSYYFLISSFKEAPQSSLSYMMNVVRRRFALSRGKYYVKAGEPQFDKLASDLKNEKKKVLLVVTAFALNGFLYFV